MPSRVNAMDAFSRENSNEDYEKNSTRNVTEEKFQGATNKVTLRKMKGHRKDYKLLACYKKDHCKLPKGT